MRTDRDKGWDAILAAIIALPGAEISVGILGEAGQDIVNRATWNEFGTKTIPARSFIRSTFDENTARYQRLAAKYARKLGTDISVSSYLQKIGMTAVADIQVKIVKLRTPPNAEATIRAKKSSNPLIDTGHMRQSVNYEVKR